MSKVSVREVAQHAGVSVGTVSHALNHPDRVAGPTLARVNAAIEDLGFIRSGSARQLRAGRSATVALIVRDIANPFYVEAARALEEQLAPLDLALLLCATGEDPDRLHRAVRLVLEHQVRAVVVAAEQASDEVVDELLRHDQRVVMLDAGAARTDVGSVSVDSVAGGRLALEHLLGLGHRRVGIITGPARVVQTIDRLEGARQAVRQAGLDPERVLTVVPAPAFTAESGDQAMARLVDAGTGCTATFAANDLMALGAMRALRARGLTIPHDMALVGYDDIPVAAELSPPLTSVRQPLADLGLAAADLALREPTQPVTRVVLPPTLIVRESTNLRRGLDRDATLDS